MLQNLKANKTTLILSKISSVYECNKTITLLPRFELTQIFEHERQTTRLPKVTAPNLKIVSCEQLLVAWDSFIHLV